MTPQESELVDELFNRLVQLETAQRDPEAERLIADGLRRAPHAVYALVQTVLLQDEALKRANARIEELQVQTNAATEPEQRPASFLDSMREALGGRAHGSVPSVRRAGANQSQGQPPQPGYPGAPGFGSGGSFLGTAASAAAGVIGGSLLLDGVRSMFGHHLGAASASPFARGDDKFATYADREQDRQQDLADDDREQDRQQDLADEDAQQDAEQDLADEDAQQDAEQDLADEDAQQDSEQDLTDNEDFAGDDGYDA
jgi:uncharacterized protein